MGPTVIEPRACPIAFAAIDRYAERYGIAGADFELLLALVTALDAEFLRWEGERASARAREMAARMKR